MSSKLRSLRWVVMGAVFVLVTVAFVVGREKLRLPASVTDDTVVAVLGAASAPYPLEARAAAAKARSRPDDPTAAAEAARQYLDYGRRVGDARFAGAALGVLEPWLSKPDSEILNLAADAKQYGHDFAGAVALLDAATKASPHDAQALLSRANINIVQGRFKVAEADCLNLARARRADLAILCDATAKALLSEAPDAYVRLERMVSVKAMDPALLGYAHSLLGEIAHFQGWTDKAILHFQAAHDASPRDLRTLMIYADLLLAEKRPADALALLKDAPQTDSIMVRQALAQKILGNAGEVDRLRSALSRRFDEQTRLGEVAHAREAARFWLYVADRPAQALMAAQANWTNQRELEDALLLLASAQAANAPDAAKPVIDWARDEGVVAPMFVGAVKAEAVGK